MEDLNIDIEEKVDIEDIEPKDDDLDDDLDDEFDPDLDDDLDDE